MQRLVEISIAATEKVGLRDSTETCGLGNGPLALAQDPFNDKSVPMK